MLKTKVKLFHLGFIALALSWFAFNYVYTSKPLEQRLEEVQAEDYEPIPSEGERSSKWPTVRKYHIQANPVCVACGSKEGLHVHHIKPFHSHPELELVPTNLITLCREHHFSIGHDPDGPGPRKPDWKESNPNVIRDAQLHRHKLKYHGQ